MRCEAVWRSGERTELDGVRGERGDRAAVEERVAALRAGPADGGEQRREARAAGPQQRARRPRARAARALHTHRHMSNEQ